ncbi:hypothetical protein HCX48_12645 [Rhodocyclus tenuis]|uniref:Uncharacterized protein n=1 Tax=Rhodocyclus gracilis TaxID=2929842 RepID=A0ABX0WNB7_9RHOO|nr:hypothetical protein [Rhodocyclus gracilis]NJA90060.1 hypothetical protein [Rhodocyclus gracilis]
MKAIGRKRQAEATISPPRLGGFHTQAQHDAPRQQRRLRQDAALLPLARSIAHREPTPHAAA